MSSEDTADPFVRLTTARDNVETMGIRSLLESEGIDVFVQGEHHRALEGALLGAFVELVVMVRRSDLDDARELLEEAQYAEHLPAEEVAVDQIDDASIHRFRAQSPDEHRPSLRRPRPALAILLAVLVPLGAGHFYVGKRGIGIVLGALLVLDWILFFRGWNVTFAVLALVGIDALGAAVSARRAGQRDALELQDR
jgi:hypothetical protein